jgi:LmbE family N-acetylglucosaminyl deacetylase
MSEVSPHDETSIKPNETYFYMHLKDLKKFRRKALVIVAHPDDESLFMGGTIAEFKKWRWTVLCITDCDERYNKRRRRELLVVSGFYNRNGSHVKPVMLGVVKRKGRLAKDEVAKKTRDFIGKNGPFDVFFTHGSKGDYGHKTHKLVCDAIKKLRLPDVYNFCISSHRKSASMAPARKPLEYTQVIDLSPRSRRIKKQAINVYLKGSQKTNLSRLKRFVACALNTRTELFNSSN